jgi:hypothetical protein
MRKESHEGHFLLTLALAGLLVFVSACSSEPEDPDPTYSQNLFYSGGPDMPTHQRKANVDFFNKVCVPTGQDGHQSGTYRCYFTND